MSYENDIKVAASISDVALSSPDDRTKDPSLMVQFRIADDGPWPQKVTAYLSFSEKAIPYTEEKLRACGWDPTTNAWGINELVEMKPIVGNDVDLVIAEEEYDGKLRWKVKFINEPGGGMARRATTDAARDFTEALRRRLGVAAPASAGMRKPSAAQRVAMEAQRDAAPAQRQPRPAARPQPAQRAAEPVDADPEGIPF